MDGVSNLTGGTKGTFEIDGKTYQFSPFTIADFGEIEREIVNKHKPDPLRLLSSESLTEDIKTQLQRELSRAKFASLEESQEYMQSMTGGCHILLLSLRKKHPEDFKTLDDAFWLMMRANKLGLSEQLNKIVGQIMEHDILGN